MFLIKRACFMQKNVQTNGFFEKISAKKSNMNRVMPDLDKVFFHLPNQGVASCFLHIAFHVEKTFKNTAGTSEKWMSALFSV